LPLTPYHVGPGVLIKALLRGSFSLMVFVWAQILIDLQPLVVLTTGRGQLHGFSHTYLGATLIGVGAALSGKYAVQWIVRFTGGAQRVSWAVAFLSALIGTYSHVALDSLVYSDVSPFQPFAAVNPFLGVASLRSARLACVLCGLAGLVLYLAVELAGPRHNKRIIGVTLTQRDP